MENNLLLGTHIPRLKWNRSVDLANYLKISKAHPWPYKMKYSNKCWVWPNNCLANLQQNKNKMLRISHKKMVSLHILQTHNNTKITVKDKKITKSNIKAYHTTFSPDLNDLDTFQNAVEMRMRVLFFVSFLQWYLHISTQFCVVYEYIQFLWFAFVFGNSIWFVDTSFVHKIHFCVYVRVVYVKDITMLWCNTEQGSCDAGWW